MHFQKCFTESGCHPWFGRKFILLPFLQLKNPFVVDFKIVTAFNIDSLLPVGRLCAVSGLASQKLKESAHF